jgi:hypothetical protein
VKVKYEAEYFDLKLSLSGEAAKVGEGLKAGVWGGIAAVASSRHTEVAWSKTDEVPDALSGGLGIFLTMVPGTTRDVAELVASELRTNPLVVDVGVIPCTWAISPDAFCLSSSTANDHPRLFVQLLLAFYLYDPEGMGVANSYFVNNPDEYAAEVKEVVLNLPKVRSTSEVEQLLGEVWTRFFRTTRNMGALAREIWGIWLAETSAD